MTASPTPDVVTVDHIVNLHRRRPRWTVRLRLSWVRADPLVVTVTVTAQPDHPAIATGRWTIMRASLETGLHHRVDAGAVMISPSPSGDRLVLEMTSDGRPCYVSVTGATVREFLDATDRVLPSNPGADSSSIIDVISQLLLASS